MKTSFSYSQVMAGYIFSAVARHLSKNTIRTYILTITRFHEFLQADPPIRQITQQQVQSFLAGLSLSKKPF